MTFLDRFMATCARDAAKAALLFLAADGSSQRPVHDGALETLVRRTISYLQEEGVEEGDRVALSLPKGLPFILLHLATMRLGAISLPLNPVYPLRELRYFLEDAAARICFAGAPAGAGM